MEVDREILEKIGQALINAIDDNGTVEVLMGGYSDNDNQFSIDVGFPNTWVYCGLKFKSSKALVKALEDYYISQGLELRK